MAQWRLENNMKPTQKSLSIHVNNWVRDGLITRGLEAHATVDDFLSYYPIGLYLLLRVEKRNCLVLIGRRRYLCRVFSASFEERR